MLDFITKCLGDIKRGNSHMLIVYYFIIWPMWNHILQHTPSRMTPHGVARETNSHIRNWSSHYIPELIQLFESPIIIQGLETKQFFKNPIIWYPGAGASTIFRKAQLKEANSIHGRAERTICSHTMINFIALTWFTSNIIDIVKT